MACERGSLVSASDGLPARCVGPWSKDKFFYIGRYLEIVSRAMRRKFPHINYLDLFSGPGKCVFDDGSGEHLGSPLLALSLEYKFSTYHFVEADHQALTALKTRVSRAGGNLPVEYYEGDANEVTPRLAEKISPGSLNIAVIDPTGLHFSFDSLRVLTQGRRVDLIYLFPEGMDINRNKGRYAEEDESNLDRVLGVTHWRDRVASHAVKSEPNAVDLWEWDKLNLPIVEVFREQLHTLKYVDVKIASKVVVRNRQNAPLYHLVFASKSPLGNEFWEKIQKVGPTGQKKFDF